MSAFAEVSKKRKSFSSAYSLASWYGNVEHNYNNEYKIVSVLILTICEYIHKCNIHYCSQILRYKVILNITVELWFSVNDYTPRWEIKRTKNVNISLLRVQGSLGIPLARTYLCGMWGFGGTDCFSKSTRFFQKKICYAFKILWIVHLHCRSSLLLVCRSRIWLENSTLWWWLLLWDCISLLAYPPYFTALTTSRTYLNQKQWGLKELHLTLVFTILCASRSALFPARAITMSGLAKVLSLLTHVLTWVNVFCVKIIRVTAPLMEYCTNFNIILVTRQD